MGRDYDLMRAVLATVAGSHGPAKYGSFYDIRDEAALKRELARLERDGLIDSTITFQGGDGICLGGEASITNEGREFLRLIENDRAWELMRRTLDDVGIDVPYPLLKDVCEEIVRRYVASFIPDVPRARRG